MRAAMAVEDSEEMETAGKIGILTAERRMNRDRVFHISPPSTNRRHPEFRELWRSDVLCPGPRRRGRHLRHLRTGGFAPITSRLLNLLSLEALDRVYPISRRGHNRTQRLDLPALLHTAALHQLTHAGIGGSEMKLVDLHPPSGGPGARLLRLTNIHPTTHTRHCSLSILRRSNSN